MLESYFMNASSGMTKDMYFEMCEQLGNDPIDSEVPVETEDFPDEIQQALDIYFWLRDEWDSMSGTYMGKSFAGLGDILDIYGIEKADRAHILDWIFTMDRIRSKCIELAKPKKD